MNESQYKICIEGGKLTDAEYLKNAPANEIKRKEIIKQFGSWAVTRYGLQSLSFHYAIEATRLWESHTSGRGWTWESHMKGKRWVVQGDFLAGLKAAREIHADRSPTRGPNVEPAGGE